MRAFIGLAVLFVAFGAQAQERQISFDFVGFSGDGTQVVLKKYDHNVGWSYDVYQLADGVSAKRYAFDDSNEKAILKKLTKTHAVQPGDGPKSPDGKLFAMGCQDGKYLDVLIMEKPRIGRFEAIEMPIHKTTKKPAEGMLKQAIWSPDGTWLVVVFTVKTEEYERDEFRAFKFRKWKVKWFREEEAKP